MHPCCSRVPQPGTPTSMSSRFAVLRRIAPSLGVVLALVLSASTFIGGVHRHSVTRPHEPCAVCIVGHAPAVASVAVAAPAGPAPTSEAIQAPPDVIVAPAFR